MERIPTVTPEKTKDQSTASETSYHDDAMGLEEIKLKAYEDGDE